MIHRVGSMVRIRETGELAKIVNILNNSVGVWMSIWYELKVENRYHTHKRSEAFDLFPISKTEIYKALTEEL